MPASTVTPARNLESAVAALTSTSIAFAFLNSLPANERAGYVKARIRFEKATRAYHQARAAYLAAYPHRESVTPVLVAAR